MTVFTEDEIDVLKEIFNISYSLATSLITNTTGCCARLHAPDINILPIEMIGKQIEELPISKNNMYIIDQKYAGSFRGESLLLIEDVSAKKLGALMLDEDEDDLSTEDVESCAQELANILTSASIGKLAELLSSHMSFAPPTATNSDIESIIGNFKKEDFRRFFVVKTWLNTDELSIQGYLFIFIREESFPFLHDAIEEFIENYG